MPTLLKRSLIRLAPTILVGVLAGSCLAGGDDDADSNGNAAGDNLFANPGFEEGDEPWITLNPESGFTVTDEFAHSGAYSAVQHMDDPADSTGTGPTNSKVYYLVQEMAPAEFPEIVKGYYRVENWERGTPLQYLQFVVIAFDPQNFDPSFAPNYQLRYVIAGVDSEPLETRGANFHYVFLSRDDPVIGEWTQFTANIREDFERLWNMAPENSSSLRLLFEVRWDHKSAGSGTPRADVYWDDLYIGNN